MTRNKTGHNTQEAQVRRVADTAKQVMTLVFDCIVSALRDESRHVRRAAITALRDIGEDRAVVPLLNALEQETDANLRGLIVSALINVGLNGERCGDVMRVVSDVAQRGSVDDRLLVAFSLATVANRK